MINKTRKGGLIQYTKKVIPSKLKDLKNHSYKYIKQVTVSKPKEDIFKERRFVVH